MDSQTVSNLLINLEVLNDDVLSIIKSFLAPEVKWCLTKKWYIKEHKIVKSLIPENRYDAYVRDMIRHDYAFVFEQILEEKFDIFHKWKRFKFQDNVYPSYLIYLRDFAFACNSRKCHQLIDNFAIKKGFGSNWYKYRNSIKLATRWTNSI